MLTDILFLRQDDGTFLAIHISSTRGRDLLRLHRELTAQIGTPTYQTTPPFGLNTVYEDRSSGAQTPTLKDNEPSIPASSAPTVQPPAKVSTDSSLDPRTGFSSTDVWMDTIFSSADGQSYDRDWIKIHNVNDSILKGIPSKHKLDLLVRFGAVVVGDKLCVTYHSLGYPVIREGEVLQGSTSSNLCVRIAPARKGLDGILRSIQGPKDLIAGMNKEFAARYDHAVLGGWKDVTLSSSSGQDFGTLYNVRQVYQVWADQRAKWVTRKILVAA